VNELDAFKGEIHRGAGAVARWPGICIVTPSHDDNTDAISEFYRQLGSRPTLESLELVVTPFLPQLIAFAAIVETSNGYKAMAFGPMMIIVDGKPILQGSSKLAEIDFHKESTNKIVIRQDNEKPSTPIAPYDLREGISPGAGLSIFDPNPVLSTEPESAENAVQITEPESAEDAAQIAEPESAEIEDPNDESLVGNLLNNSMENSLADINPSSEPEIDQIEAISSPEKETFTNSVLLSTLNPVERNSLPIAGQEPEMEESEKAPIVSGIMCSRNHFNHPDSTLCMVCGLSIASSDGVLITRPRPTLGFIIFDDGSTFGLDRSYVIGRNPESDSDFEILRLQDNNETISRSHAVIKLDEWSVKIIDKGSTNGTFIWNRQDEAWDQLQPDQEVEIISGTTIALGRRAFVFESARQPKIKA